MQEVLPFEFGTSGTFLLTRLALHLTYLRSKPWNIPFDPTETPYPEVSFRAKQSLTSGPLTKTQPQDLPSQYPSLFEPLNIGPHAPLYMPLNYP